MQIFRHDICVCIFSHFFRPQTWKPKYGYKRLGALDDVPMYVVKQGQGVQCFVTVVLTSSKFVLLSRISFSELNENTSFQTRTRIPSPRPKQTRKNALHTMRSSIWAIWRKPAVSPRVCSVCFDIALHSCPCAADQVKKGLTNPLLKSKVSFSCDCNELF